MSNFKQLDLESSKYTNKKSFFSVCFSSPLGYFENIYIVPLCISNLTLYEVHTSYGIKIVNRYVAIKFFMF